MGGSRYVERMQKARTRHTRPAICAPMAVPGQGSLRIIPAIAHHFYDFAMVRALSVASRPCNPRANPTSILRKPERFFPIFPHFRGKLGNLSYYCYLSAYPHAVQDLTPGIGVTHPSTSG